MKKNIFLTLLVFLSLAVTAQDNNTTNSDTKSYKPTKRGFTVGIQLGRGNFLNTGLNIFNGNNVSGTPTLTPINTANNSAVNMVGIDARYFISNKWAVTFSGAMSYSETPANLAIPAVTDPTNGNVIIPGYSAVVSDSRVDYSYSVGALYFFNYKKNPRVLPYLGFTVPVSHARRSSYDPTISANGTPVDLGQSHVEVSGFGIQAVAGLDYYLSENFFLGASIKPVSFMSINNTRFPGPGLYSRKINNYNVSSFVQPMLTLGFKL